MPAHGKPIDFTKIKPHHIGYLGTTTHRGTQLMTPKQVKLLNARCLPHTDVYRTGTGNIRRERKCTHV